MMRRSPEQLTMLAYLFAFKFVHLTSSLCERMVAMIEEKVFGTTLSILPPAVLSVKTRDPKTVEKTSTM